jgi:TctA family transporter
MAFNVAENTHSVLIQVTAECMNDLMEILSGFNSTPQVLTHFQTRTSYNSSQKTSIGVATEFAILKKYGFPGDTQQSLFSYVTSVTLSQTSYNFDVLSTKLNKHLDEPSKHCLNNHNKTAA